MRRASSIASVRRKTPSSAGSGWSWVRQWVARWRSAVSRRSRRAGSVVRWTVVSVVAAVPVGIAIRSPRRRRCCWRRRRVARAVARAVAVSAERPAMTPVLIPVSSTPAVGVMSAALVGGAGGASGTSAAGAVGGAGTGDAGAGGGVAAVDSDTAVVVVSGGRSNPAGGSGMSATGAAAAAAGSGGGGAGVVGRFGDLGGAVVVGMISCWPMARTSPVRGWPSAPVISG